MNLITKHKQVFKHIFLILNIVFLLGTIVLCFLVHFVTIDFKGLNLDKDTTNAEAISLADIVFGGRFTKLVKVKLSFSPLPFLAFFLLVFNLFFVYFFFLKLWIRLIITGSSSIVNLTLFLLSPFLIKYDGKYLLKKYIDIEYIYYIVMAFLIALIIINVVVLIVWYIVKRKEKLLPEKTNKIK